MKMEFFLRNLRLQLGQAFKRLPLLLLMIVILLLFSLLVASLALHLYGSEKHSKIPLVLSTYDEQINLQHYFILAKMTPDLGDMASFEQVEPAQALEMVASGEAAAAIIFPENFFKGLGSGQVASPQLILNSGRQLEADFAKKMVGSSLHILSLTNQGSAYVQDVASLQGLDFDKQELGQSVSAYYFNWLFKNDLFTRALVNATGELSIIQSYLLSSLVFFLLLATPLFYRHLSLFAFSDWCRRLLAAGVSLPVYALTLIISFALVLCCPLLIILLLAYFVSPLPIFLSAQLIFTILLTSFFITLLGWLFCNAGNITTAAGLNFILAMALLFSSGSLLPPVLMPASLVPLIPWSPMTWSRSNLATLYGVQGDPKSLVYLFLITILLLVISLLRAWQLESRL